MLHTATPILHTHPCLQALPAVTQEAGFVPAAVTLTAVCGFSIITGQQQLHINCASSVSYKGILIGQAQQTVARGYVHHKSVQPVALPKEWASSDCLHWKGAAMFAMGRSHPNTRLPSDFGCVCWCFHSHPPPNPPQGCLLLRLACA